MRAQTFQHSVRNLLVLALSLLVAFVATAGADRIPQQQQQHRDRRGHTPAAPVRHDTKFAAVPGGQLQIRAVVYDGSTNGTLTVQVKNPTKSAQKFSATGLYFVPDGDPASAPQRLGAVGPMQLTSAQGQEIQEVEIAANATVEVALDVFCIDSHRASPSPQNRFSVGTKRMPKELARTIERSADEVVRQERASGNAKPRAAKGRIQGEVWKSRDSDWVELEGEGKQELSKKKK